MIDAKDLRLNNYVAIDNKESWPMVSGLPMQVISISQRADEDFPNSNASITMQRGNDLFSQFNEFICPIVLTEEILIKAGFKRQNNALNGPYKNDFSLWNPREETIFTLNDTLFTPKIKYIHQLQNLYYILTGEELSFNL
jgi:hypothetical protein